MTKPDGVKVKNVTLQLNRQRTAMIIYGSTNYLTGDLLMCAKIVDAINLKINELLEVG